MALDVIGVGFGRTGTYSLKLALEHLGFGPTYHMRALYQRADAHGPLWLDARDLLLREGPTSKGCAAHLGTVLRGFGSTVDWPGAYFWRPLCALHPEAKVILTVRASDAWYGSARETIFPSIQRAAHPSPWQQRVAQRLVIEDTFAGRVKEREIAIQTYLAHIEEVRRTLAPERLLIYNVQEGWAPLARFLGVPEPGTPFPRSNTRADFQARRQLTAEGESDSPR